MRKVKRSSVSRKKSKRSLANLLSISETESYSFWNIQKEKKKRKKERKRCEISTVVEAFSLLLLLLLLLLFVSLTLAARINPRWRCGCGIPYNRHAGQRYRGADDGREVQTGAETRNGQETSQRQGRIDTGRQRTVQGTRSFHCSLSPTSLKELDQKRCKINELLVQRSWLSRVVQHL